MGNAAARHFQATACIYAMKLVFKYNRVPELIVKHTYLIKNMQLLFQQDRVLQANTGNPVELCCSQMSDTDHHRQVSAAYIMNEGGFSKCHIQMQT